MKNGPLDERFVVEGEFCPCGGRFFDAGPPIGYYCEKGFDCPEAKRMASKFVFVDIDAWRKVKPRPTGRDLFESKFPDSKWESLPSDCRDEWDFIASIRDLGE